MRDTVDEFYSTCEPEDQLTDPRPELQRMAKMPKATYTFIIETGEVGVAVFNHLVASGKIPKEWGRSMSKIRTHEVQNNGKEAPTMKFEFIFDDTASIPSTPPMPPSTAWPSVGEIVITGIKNRQGINCAGKVQKRNETTADVLVWNMQGPGANTLVTGIPFSELTPDKNITLEKP